jgi:hypothetical protein
MYWGCTAVINKNMMVFQNYAGIEKDVPVPCGVTCPTSYDADLAMNIKAKEVSDEEEEGDPLAVTSPRIKDEPKAEEVSDEEEEGGPLAVTSQRIKTEPKAEEVSDAEEEGVPLAITSPRIKTEPKAEEVSDAEEEDDPLAITFPEPKAEEVSDAEEEDDPVAITFPRMKAEPEVSCMSLSHSSLLAAISRALPEMSLDNCSLLNVACGVPLQLSSNLYATEPLMLRVWLNMVSLLHQCCYQCDVYKHISSRLTS